MGAKQEAGQQAEQGTGAPPHLEYAGGCPVVHGYDPLRPDVVSDPGPWFSAARTEVSAFYVPAYEEWVSTTYDAVDEIMNDTDTFSRSGVDSFPKMADDYVEQFPFDGRWAMQHTAGKTGPEHTRLRRLFAPAFAARQAANKADEIAVLANELIDGFIDKGTTDLVPDYANNIPVAVICSLLGVPQADAPRIFDWAVEQIHARGNPHMNDAEIREYSISQLDFERYIAELIEDRRANPRGDSDFVTNLITATTTGLAPLTEGEVAGIIANSIFAGTDTSASSLGLIVHALLSERSRWDYAAISDEHLKLAVEEGLRFCNPLRGTGRLTTKDVEMPGVTIPRGSRVRVSTWAGNRDSSKFEHPDEFRPERHNVREHVTFGRGPHACLGSHFARQEIVVAIDVLMKRMPSLRLVPGHDLVLHPSRFIPTLTSGVVVEWDERSTPTNGVPQSES